jgi:hypothetical protein
MMMSEEQIIERIIEFMKSVDETRWDGEGGDAALLRDAYRMYSKLRKRGHKALQELVMRGDSESVERFIRDEMERPPLGEDARRWVEKEVASHYKERYRGRKDVPGEIVDSIIQDETRKLLASIDIEAPDDLEGHVRTHLRLDDYYNELGTIKNKILKLGPGQEDKAQALQDRFDELVGKMESTDPQEFHEGINMRVSQMATQLGAYYSSGRIGSVSSVYRVQGERIGQACDALSRDKGMEALGRHAGLLKGLNMESGGLILDVLVWAAGNAGEDERPPDCGKALGFLKKEDPALADAFRKACKLAERNFKRTEA